MAKVEPSYRNDLEASVGAQLAAAGISPNYEKIKLEYEVPARTARYTPDFPVGNIIIECKGYFGGEGRGANAKEAVRTRQKMVQVKEQYPHLDIRFVFSDERKKLYKGSLTTYARWAEDHGFKWARKTIPAAWITDLKREQEKLINDSSRKPEAEAKRSSRLKPSRKEG